MGNPFGNDLARHAQRLGMWAMTTTEYRPPETLWILYEFREEVDDIIGYFYSQNDAVKAKKYWKKKGFSAKGSRLEVHSTHVWASAKDFKEFWREDK